MAEDTYVIVDEIKFFFTYQGKRYKAHAYVVDKIENDQYACQITGIDDKGDIKDVDLFYFDSCGGMTEEVSDLAQAVLDILFDDNGMIRGGF